MARHSGQKDAHHGRSRGRARDRGLGPEYVLPNKNTYDETCAAVGSVMFNYRMFLLTRDAKYVDVAEAALYNNVLAGVNIEGNRFFYVNPLETDAAGLHHGRKGRFAVVRHGMLPLQYGPIDPAGAGYDMVL